KLSGRPRRQLELRRLPRHRAPGTSMVANTTLACRSLAVTVGLPAAARAAPHPVPAHRPAKESVRGWIAARGAVAQAVLGGGRQAAEPAAAADRGSSQGRATASP